MASLFEVQGWQVAGAVSLPFSRKWSKCDFQASILGRHDPSIEFVLREIKPDWNDSTYVNAVNSSYAPQVGEVEGVREELLGLLGRHAVPEFVGDVSEVEELITGSDWMINDALLSIGVAHLDAEDLPILLLVYLTRRAASH